MKTMGLLVFVFVAKLALELHPEQGRGGAMAQPMEYPW